MMELQITIVSAKNLKNVNWRNEGDLKPYTVAYLDPDRRSATKPDGSRSTKPIWNECLVLPLPLNANKGIILTIDVFHSKPFETPKPLVGTARVPLRDLLDSSPSVECNYASSNYEHKPKGIGRMGMGAELVVGAVAGTLGGLALEEGIKYEENKIFERVEDDYSKDLGVFKEVRIYDG